MTAPGREEPGPTTGATTRSLFSHRSSATRGNPLDAFRTTVARLHDAGIEVILDVVYNHTAEGNHLGPTLSFRGIDNASYYWLHAGQSALLRQFHRLRQLAESHPSARAADGDGFAALLGRGMSRRWFPFRSRHHTGARRRRLRPWLAFFTAIRQDPVLANVKLIAEPWDIGPGGYQVGGFPAGWSEWNDRFRRTLRRYWAGDGRLLGEAVAPDDRLRRRVQPRRPQPAFERQPRYRA